MAARYFSLVQLFAGALGVAFISVSTTLYIVSLESIPNTQVITVDKENRLETHAERTKTDNKALVVSAITKPPTITEAEPATIKPTQVIEESEQAFIPADIPEDAIVYRKKLSEAELAQAESNVMEDFPVYSTKLSKDKLEALGRAPLQETEIN